MAAQPQATVEVGKQKLTRRYLRLVALVIQIAIIVWIGYVAPPWKYWPMWLSAAIWVIFGSYWSVAARNAAEAKSRESTKSRRVHEVLMNGGLLLLFIPVPGLRGWFHADTIAWSFVGLGVQCSFFALAVWARRHLGRNWSARIEIKKEHELIRSGPYRLLRHPIYTANIGMYVGTAVVSGQWHAAVGVAMVLIAYWRKVRMEESKLRESFGDEYFSYRRATWGAVPGLF